ncbi:hypothetical protein FQR65_LT09116 [Abscondita terminalis]|nr:hypothetical protein FQR65_LT09116 [Abscondita terminalis]
MTLRVFVCFLLAACLTQRVSATVSQLKSDVLYQILPKNAYDVFVPPENNTGDVIDIETSIHVLDVENINEKDREVTLLMYFRQSWKDERLKYAKDARFDYVTLNDDGAIWTPDSFFVGMRKGHGFDTVRPNVFIRISPDGRVLFSKKLAVTVGCPMDLTRFPFDRQHCALRIESYGYTTASLVMKWKKYSTFTVSDKVIVRDFQLDKTVAYSGVTHLTSGSYSYLGVDLYFTRYLNYYVHQVFLPSMVMVALSRLPFWLTKQKLIAKLLLGLAILITYTVTVFKFHSHHLKTTHVTSMHYFSWMCLGFLASSLLETVLIHALDGDNTNKVEDGNVKSSKRKAYLILTASRYVVPAMFALMCVVYFGTGGFRAGDVVEIVRSNATEIIINKS